MSRANVFPLTPDEIVNYMAVKWWPARQGEYLGESLIFYINHFTEYRITCGNKLVYQGSNLTHAINAWNNPHNHQMEA